jgi:hypothetical protein
MRLLEAQYRVYMSKEKSKNEPIIVHLQVSPFRILRRRLGRSKYLSCSFGLVKCGTVETQDTSHS